MTHKIMLIEDDESIACMLADHIKKYGYSCTVIDDFDNIMEEFKRVEPHVVLLDVNLPKYDGYYWCRKIRQISKTPIVLISARSSEMDQVMGIESGADDYVTKPFYYDVVIAKIKSQIRRIYGEYAKGEDSHIFKVGNTQLSLDTFRIATQSFEESLTLKEMQLCNMLFEAFPHAVTRQKLLSAIWDNESFVEENTLTVNIGRLRKKMEIISSNLVIRTIRGIGYQLEEAK